MPNERDQNETELPNGIEEVVTAHDRECMRCGEEMLSGDWLYILTDPIGRDEFCEACLAEHMKEPTEAQQGLIPIPDGYAEQ